MSEAHKMYWSGREAARELGVTRPRLLRRLKRLGVVEHRAGGALLIDAKTLALLRASFREAQRLPA